MDLVPRRKLNMGIKGVGLLLILFSHLCFPVSPSPSTHQRTIFPSVPLQENNLGKGVADEKGSDAKGENHQVTHSIKIGHGHGAAGGGGEAVASRSPGSSSNGETGNNGESTKTPAAQGGAAVIPVYTAGAVNNHHTSVRGAAASHNQQSLGPLNLCASVLAILFLRVYVVCGFEN